MVNFHAVKVYVSNRGGFSMHTPYQDGFKCSAFLVGFGEDELPELRYAWMDCMETFGPDNFSTLQRCIKVRVCALISTGLVVWALACTGVGLQCKCAAAGTPGCPVAGGRGTIDSILSLASVGCCVLGCCMILARRCPQAPCECVRDGCPAPQ